MAASRSGRSLSTGSNREDEGHALDAKSPSTEKLLVFGGNGFVGSHICKEALDRGLHVSSLSRSGKPFVQDSWANSVVWHQGSLEIKYTHIYCNLLKKSNTLILLELHEICFHLIHRSRH